MTDLSRRDVLALGMAATAALSIPAVAGQVAPSRPWATGVEGMRKADLGNGHYINPILAGDHPDPSVLKDGDVYYKVSSSFHYYPGLVLWQSHDLVNWSPVGPALRQPVGSVFAPDLIKHGGRYFIYFSALNIPAPGAKPDPGASRTDGVDWQTHTSFEVAGYNHNVADGFLSLRPALYAAKAGSVIFTNLRYSAAL